MGKLSLVMIAKMNVEIIGGCDIERGEFIYVHGFSGDLAICEFAEESIDCAPPVGRFLIHANVLILAFSEVENWDEYLLKKQMMAENRRNQIAKSRYQDERDLFSSILKKPSEKHKMTAGQIILGKSESGYYYTNDLTYGSYEGNTDDTTLMVDLDADEMGQIMKLEMLSNWFQSWAASKDSNNG